MWAVLPMTAYRGRTDITFNRGSLEDSSKHTPSPVGQPNEYDYANELHKGPAGNRDDHFNVTTVRSCVR